MVDLRYSDMELSMDRWNSHPSGRQKRKASRKVEWSALNAPVLLLAQAISSGKNSLRPYPSARKSRWSIEIGISVTVEEQGPKNSKSNLWNRPSYVVKRRKNYWQTGKYLFRSGKSLAGVFRDTSNPLKNQWETADPNPLRSSSVSS